MHSILSFAVTGASLLSAVAAAPYGGPSASSHGYSTTTSLPAGSAPTNIDFLNDGFPNPNDKQLLAIEELAHGTLPNGPPPPSLSTQGGINFQFLQFNEEFEVAFFADLLHNITTNVPGYEIKGDEQQKLVIEIITAVLAQEELHSLNARKADELFGRTVIEPCPNYSFGVDNFDDAIALAAKFTDVVLGTLQDIILIFANNDDDGATAAVASVVGQEGEQEGFYRLLQNKGLIPNALPFLTRSTRDFAFSAINQDFVVGSCDGTTILVDEGLKIFGVLDLLSTNIQPKDQLLDFSFDIATLLKSANIDFSTLFGSKTAYESWSKGSPDWSSFKWSDSNLYIQLINQQNLPISEPLKNVKVDGSVVKFQADFPFTENLLNDLTIAAITVGSNFTSAEDVASATLFGPALIEVN